MKKIHTLYISIILILISGANSTVAVATSKTLPKPPCRIDIHNAHISTYMRNRKQRKYVKVDAESVCNIYQRNVTLTVQIFKIGFLTDHLVATYSTDPLNSKSSGFSVTNWNAKAECKNDTKTSYYGIAFSSALVGNKEVYAGRTQSPETFALNCGT